MSLPARQYLDMRTVLRGALAGNNPLAANPSDGEVLGFFNQLFADASGAAALSSGKSAAMAAAARGLLSGNFASSPNPNDADVLSFWAQLSTDASGAAALTAQRYLALRAVLRDVLSNNYPGVTNPSDADVLGYMAAVGAIQYFNVAYATGFNGSNRFTAVGGAAGNPPQFTIGKTMVFVCQIAGNGGLAEFGSLAGNRGWAIGVDGSTLNPYVRPLGSAAIILPNQPSGQPMCPGGVVRIAVTVTAGGQLRGSVNGCPVTGIAWAGYTPANAGDTFLFGASEIAAGVSYLYGAAFLNRSFSDAELIAASATQDDRYDISALRSDAACTQAWSARDDWDGITATSVMGGSSPVTLTNVNLTRPAYVEGRIPVHQGDVQDSTGAQISGAGINQKILGSEYGVNAFIVGSGDQTGAGLDVIGNNGVFGTYDYYLNGVYQGAPNGQWFASDNTRRTIPFEGVLAVSAGDTIEIYNSFQNNITRDGSVVQAVRFKVGAAPWRLKTYAPARRLVIVGDSIPSGVNASSSNLGWGRLVRADYPGRVTFLAYGGARLSDYAATIPDLVASVQGALNQGGATVQKEIWMELGVNDGTSGPVFNTVYAAFLDQLHATEPAARIFCQSLGVVQTGTEPAWATQQRIDIAAMCATRTWTTYVDGLTMYTSAQLTLGVHPGNAGQQAAHDRARAVIGY